MSTYDDSSSAQRTAIQAAFNSAIDATLSSLAFFNDQASKPGLDPAEQQAFVDGATQAGQDASLLSAQLNAYRTGSALGDVTPPDPGTIATVQALVAALKQKTQANADVNDIIGATNQVLGVIAKL
jgi:hypothetical protein